MDWTPPSLSGNGEAPSQQQQQTYQQQRQHQQMYRQIQQQQQQRHQQPQTVSAPAEQPWEVVNHSPIAPIAAPFQSPMQQTFQYLPAVNPLIQTFPLTLPQNSPQESHSQSGSSHIQLPATQGPGQGLFLNQTPPHCAPPRSSLHALSPILENSGPPHSPSLGNGQQPAQDNAGGPETPAREAEDTGPTLFTQCRISLAVDISGSTAGRIFNSETEFMTKIVSQLDPSSTTQNVSVLPWNHVAARPIQMQHLSTLEPGGMTAPVALLESPPHLALLKRSNLWFLLTDGAIISRDVNNFAENLAEKGMHGVPCVIVIFAKKTKNPSRCNISVGISPFAAVPNSALLFQDVTIGGKCHVLATKGCFNSLLPEDDEQPNLDESTTWDSLPTISPESAFRELVIPAARVLSASELALSDDLTINFTNLFNTDLDNNQVQQLLGNQSHLQTILLSAQSRGQSASALSWLQRQSAIPPPNPSTSVGSVAPAAPAAPADLVAASSIRRITTALQNRQSIIGPEFSALQSQIRESHRRNSQYRNSRTEIVSQAINSHRNASRASWSSSSLSAVQQAVQQTVQRPLPLQLTSLQENRPDNADAFRGECSICFESDSNLAILFKRPQDYSSATAAKNTTLTFPLAAGLGPEYDIISAWIVCENCSDYIVSQGETPFREVATSALPLVSWSRSSQRWRQALAKAIDYFNASSQPLLPILFLSILDHHLRTKAWCKLDGSFENLQRQTALRWLHTTILREVKTSGDGAKDTLGLWIKSIVTTPKNELGLIWKYPIDGFALMVSVARDLNADQELLTKTVWKKLLHHVTSRYTAKLKQSDRARMSSKVDAVKLLMDREGWIEELQKGRFRPIAVREVEAFRRLKDEMMWVEAVCGRAMGRWLGFLKELGPGKSTAECIWEVKGRWGAEAECVIERPEDVVGWATEERGRLT